MCKYLHRQTSFSSSVSVIMERGEGQRKRRRFEWLRAEQFWFTFEQWSAETLWHVTYLICIAHSLCRFFMTSWIQTASGYKNGSTQGRVFASFRRRFLTNGTTWGVEKLLCIYFYFSFIPFLSVEALFLRLRFGPFWTLRSAGVLHSLHVNKTKCQTPHGVRSFPIPLVHTNVSDPSRTLTLF